MPEVAFVIAIAGGKPLGMAELALLCFPAIASCSPITCWGIFLLPPIAGGLRAAQQLEPARSPFTFSSAGPASSALSAFPSINAQKSDKKEVLVKGQMKQFICQERETLCAVLEGFLQTEFWSSLEIPRGKPFILEGCKHSIPACPFPEMKESDASVGRHRVGFFLALGLLCPACPQLITWGQRAPGIAKGMKTSCQGAGRALARVWG